MLTILFKNLKEINEPCPAEILYALICHDQGMH